MDTNYPTFLGIVIMPQIISLMVEREKMGEKEAIHEFYSSRTYEILSKEETKMWHYSPLLLFNMWKDEKETGKLIFPEGVS